MGGHTVAMTGDGVNDILAMRESDCAITVATGADAAKSCSHIVLADNNFNSPLPDAQCGKGNHEFHLQRRRRILDKKYICKLPVKSIVQKIHFAYK